MVFSALLFLRVIVFSGFDVLLLLVLLATLLLTFAGFSVLLLGSAGFAVFVNSAFVLSCCCCCFCWFCFYVVTSGCWGFYVTTSAGFSKLIFLRFFSALSLSLSSLRRFCFCWFC